jgi:acetolactate decarboxylase
LTGKIRKNQVATSIFLTSFLVALLICCNSLFKENNAGGTETYSDIKVSGAMRNVMWKGELAGTIYLDTIANKNGLYGLGPLSFLTGELLINDGKSYVSAAATDSTMSVEKSFDVTAPFFVYGNVTEWDTLELSPEINNIESLEGFLDRHTTNFKRPFVYKLSGQTSKATIHIQNLPEGTVVSSPTEAHQGQISYHLTNEQVEIVGFFSTEHKGVFTHHDSFLHMHLITADESKMGHLDNLEIKKMKLYLPKQ